MDDYRVTSKESNFHGLDLILTKVYKGRISDFDKCINHAIDSIKQGKTKSAAKFVYRFPEEDIEKMIIMIN